MSFAKHERSCVRRLAELFEKGTTATSVQELFDSMPIDERQKHAICESLKERGVIKATYEIGQRLPYDVEILPMAVAERDRLIHDNKFELLKSRMLSSWWFGIPAFIFVVVAIILANVFRVATFYGLSPSE